MPGKWMDSEARQPATHFAGCWRLAGHHRCAVEEMERLEVARNDAAGQLVELAMALERAEKAAAVWKRAAKRNRRYRRKYSAAAIGHIRRAAGGRRG